MSSAPTLEPRKAPARSAPYARKPAAIGVPPLPREHGAWVIVYAPLLIAFAAVWPVAWARVGLILLAVTGLFLARTALGRVVQRRKLASAVAWLAIYLTIAAAGVGPLIFGYHLWSLLRLGVLAAALFAAHALLGVIPARKKLERSQWGELLAVAALTLSAPAAYVAAEGRLDGVAWCLWAICALYFGGGIIWVRTILRAIAIKGGFGWRERWRAGYGHVIYHALLLVVISLVTMVMGGLGALLSFIAYLPALARAFAGWLTLSNQTPSFKKIGLAETFYAIWFAAFMIASLRIGL